MKAKKNFSHLDDSGTARMVDVGGKQPAQRTAIAEATLLCQPETIAALRAQALPKGDALATARLAGIMAAKRTAEIIPLCHTLPLDFVGVDFEVSDQAVKITSSARTNARTGVEMEALTAAAAAALTLYDMLKAVDRSLRIEGLHLLEKRKESPSR